MRKKVELFKVLSEQNRVRILMMLLKRELCVCEIKSVLGLTTATVSNHLSYLRKEGFIEDEKDGKWTNYRIARQITNPIIKDLIESLPGWYSNEKVIQNDFILVQKVDRYEKSCSGK